MHTTFTPHSQTSNHPPTPKTTPTISHHPHAQPRYVIRNPARRGTSPLPSPFLTAVCAAWRASEWRGLTHEGSKVVQGGYRARYRAYSQARYGAYSDSTRGRTGAHCTRILTRGSRAGCGWLTVTESITAKIKDGEVLASVIKY